MGDEASFLDVWSRLSDENRDPALEVDLHAYARAVFTLDLEGRWTGARGRTGGAR